MTPTFAELFAEIDDRRAAIDARARNASATVICYDHDTISVDSSVSYGQCPDCAAVAMRTMDFQADDADKEARIAAACSTGRWSPLDFGGSDGCAVPTWEELGADR